MRGPVPDRFRLLPGRNRRVDGPGRRSAPWRWAWCYSPGSCSPSSGLRHPLLPLRVILDRTRGGSYVSVFISGVAIFATFLFLTYYLQVVKGESPLATGLLFLPMIGCILISSNLSSIVGLARLGPRLLIADRHAAGRWRDGIPDPGERDVQLRQCRAARPADPGPGLRHDLRAGHQHRYLRRRPPGLRRRLRAGQHDAAGRRLDRDLGSQHDRAQYGGQLPDHATTPARSRQRSRRPTATPSPSPSRPGCSGSASSSRSSCSRPSADSDSSEAWRTPRTRRQLQQLAGSGPSSRCPSSAATSSAATSAAPQPAFEAIPGSPVQLLAGSDRSSRRGGLAAA